MEIWMIKPMNEQKGENYIPFGINARGINKAKGIIIRYKLSDCCTSW